MGTRLKFGFKPHTSFRFQNPCSPLLTRSTTMLAPSLNIASWRRYSSGWKGRDSLRVSYGGSFEMTTLYVKLVVNSLYDVVETPPCTGPYTSSTSSSSSSRSSYGAGVTPAVTSEGDFCPADTPPPLAPSDWARSSRLPHTCIIPGTASSGQYSLVHTTLG